MKLNQDRSEHVNYDYPDFPFYIRKNPLSVFPNYAADSHWHDDIELMLILSGHMLYNVNGQIVRLETGEGILVNARQLHYGFSDDRTECVYICVLFHPLLLCTSKLFEQQYVLPVLREGAPYLHLFPDIPWQNTMLGLIRGMWKRHQEGTAPLYLQGAIHLLWNEVTSHTVPQKKPEQTSNKLMALQKMISYIHEHYTEKITLADIAAAGHCSKRSCGTLFLTYQNKTPIEFLNDFRLRKSIELMKQTDMTILELSLAVGFSGASYYAETFRQHFGMSPSEYRKQLRV